MYPRVTLFDERLARWRSTNPSASAFSEGVSPFVFTTLLINVNPAFSSVEISGLPQPPDERVTSFQELVTFLTSSAIPLLDESKEPAGLVAAAPVAWHSMLDAGAVEWALACGDPAAAAELIRRNISTPIRGRQRWESRLEQFSRGAEIAARGERPAQLGLEALGWLARTHRLVEVEDLTPPEQQPPEQPPRPPTSRGESRGLD